MASAGEAGAQSTGEAWTLLRQRPNQGTGLLRTGPEFLAEEKRYRSKGQVKTHVYCHWGYAEPMGAGWRAGMEKMEEDGQATFFGWRLAVGLVESRMSGIYILRDSVYISSAGLKFLFILKMN